MYHGYGEADRLTSVRWQAAEGGTVYAFQWDYDLVGNRSEFRGHYTDLPGSPACYFEYEWDAASRITLIRRENRDTIYYGYDLGDRLTSEEWRAGASGVLYAFQWDYDLVGNRVYESAAGVRGNCRHSVLPFIVKLRIGGKHDGQVPDSLA